MVARGVQRPPRDVSGVVLGLALSGALLALWFGYPGLVLVWGGFLTAGALAQPPILTGKKDVVGRPTVAGPGEQKQLDDYRFWTHVRWRLLAPTSGWMPGWPVLASWLAGLGSGVLVSFWPLNGQLVGTPLPSWSVWVNAGAAAVVVWQVSASKRATAAESDPSPGTRVDTLPALVKGDPKQVIGLGAAALAVAVLVAWLAVQFVPAVVSTSGPLGVVGAWLVPVVAALLAAGGVMARAWQGAALAVWRERVRVRAEWAPRWVAVKADPAPTLVEHRGVGEGGIVTVDTFEAPPSLGAGAFYAMGPKLRPTLGANTRIAILETPDLDGQGEPVAGTAHSRRFEVVTWPADQTPDISLPGTDPDLARLMVRASFGLVSGGGAAFEPMTLTSIELVTEPDSPAVWATQWAALGATNLQNYRQTPHVNGQVGATINVAEAVEHRMGTSGVLFIGAIADPQVRYTDGSGGAAESSGDGSTGGQGAGMAADIAWALGEDEWRRRWAGVLKQNVNAPPPYKGLTGSATLPDGEEIQWQTFTTLHAEASSSYMLAKYEEAMAAAIPGSAAFCTFSYFSRPMPGRTADRHVQAFTVAWSASSVPPLPGLKPARGEGPKWVVSGHVSRAFKDARLARPEVLRVGALTAETSQEHIWRIEVKLYDGVTFADVRGAAPRLRQSLGVSWLRVAHHEQGATLYAGAAPRRVRLARPQRDADLLVQLDWEQAWLDSKVSGVGAITPTLTKVGALPANEQVQVLDFDLPAGLGVSDVKAATEKLKTATANAFVEVRAGVSGASSMRLLVAENDPLPSLALYDYEAGAELEGLPFGTGVDGSPVCFDPKVSPHLLVVGASGGGKSVTLQKLLFGALARDWDVVLLDPTKEAADFEFADGYLRATATEISTSLAVMKAVYEEGRRRKSLNAKHGVGSFRDLPAQVRPRPLLVIIDEFTSLIGQDLVPKLSKDDIDPEAEAERDLVLAENTARVQIGGLSGRIARELRSAGVVLVLATQKLSAKILDGIPGSADLRSNLARILLGNASSGDRMAALRLPFDAPALGEAAPKGRGLWESVDAPAKVVQAWYEPGGQQELRARLAASVEPLPEDAKWDLAPFMPRRPHQEPPPGPAAGMGADEPELVDLDELEVSLDDLVASDEPATTAGTARAGERSAHSGKPSSETEVPAWARAAAEAMSHTAPRATSGSPLPETTERADESEPAGERATAGDTPPTGAQSLDDWGLPAPARRTRLVSRTAPVPDEF